MVRVADGARKETLPIIPQKRSGTFTQDTKMLLRVKENEKSVQEKKKKNK